MNTDHHQQQIAATLSQQLLTHIDSANRSSAASAFRAAVAQVTGSVRQLVQLNGLADAVRGELNRALHSLKKSAAAAAVAAASSTFERADGELSLNEFRWCVVVEELRTLKKRFAGKLIASDSLFGGGSLNGNQQQQQQHDPLFAGVIGNGAASSGVRDWDSLFSAGAADDDTNGELREILNDGFAIVHFLVDADSMILCPQLEAAAAVSPLLVSAHHRRLQQQRHPQLLCHGDPSRNGNGTAGRIPVEDAVVDVMSLLWKGKPGAQVGNLASSSASSAAGKKSSAHSGKGDEDSSSSPSVTAASSHAVLHGGGGSDASGAEAVASAHWLQVECAVLMNNGAMIRRHDLSRRLCPNALLPRAGFFLLLPGEEFTERDGEEGGGDVAGCNSYRQHNLDSILSMAPVIATQRQKQQQQQQQQQRKHEGTYEEDDAARSNAGVHDDNGDDQFPVDDEEARKDVCNAMLLRQQQLQRELEFEAQQQHAIPIQFVGSRAIQEVTAMMNRVAL